VSGDAVGAASISFVNPFEVEISQIHVSVRQYVYGENIFPFAQTDFEKLRSQIPMVPLTPGKRVCRIICRPDQSVQSFRSSIPFFHSILSGTVRCLQ
jgi:hypothetical protein